MSLALQMFLNVLAKAGRVGKGESEEARMEKAAKPSVWFHAEQNEAGGRGLELVELLYRKTGLGGSCDAQRHVLAAFASLFPILCE